MSFRSHPLFLVAKHEMHLEMGQFPWVALDTLQEAAEQDARAAGFTTARQADAQQVAHVTTLVERILKTGLLLSRHGEKACGQKIVLTLTSDLEERPRSRGMVLSLQAIVNGGLPAFISDRTEPADEHHCVRYVADLLIVYPYDEAVAT